MEARSKNNLLFCCLGFLSCILVILLRYPPFILEPRLWAEENLYYEIFFSSDNWWDGFDALIYPAYYIGLSRVAGLFAAMVNPEYAATVTTYFGLLILLIPFFIIFFSSSSYWSNLQQKVVLSLFLIFSCSTGEIWLNSTNIHFILPITVFLILLDDNLQSKIKRIFYPTYLGIAVITGPISLFMAPFFFFRYMQKKEKQVLLYCLVFLLFGIAQIIFFLISSNLGLINANRGNYLELDFLSRIYYWASPNIIFPIFGYFVSLAFRTFMIFINTGGDHISSLAIFQDNLPNTLGILLEKILVSATTLSGLINLGVIISIIYIFYKELRKSVLDEKIYFIGLFLYLSLLLNFLSLGGHGGFRYSYLTSFILLFYLFQQFSRSGKLFNKPIVKLLLTISIVVGVVEYYPRVISYTPETLKEEGASWPIWHKEIEKWRVNDNYKPIIWPHLNTEKTVWPKRTRIYSVNLIESEQWNKQGRYKFSKELYKLFYGDVDKGFDSSSQKKKNDTKETPNK